jgi:hypothetical protein
MKKVVLDKLGHTESNDVWQRVFAFKTPGGYMVTAVTM